MHQLGSEVEVDGKDIFVSDLVVRREQDCIIEIRLPGGIQLERSFFHDPVSSLRSLLEIVGISVIRIGNVVILPVGTFVKAETSLEG